MSRSFEDYNISSEIVKSLTMLGYSELTEVQSEVMPLALEKKDIIVKSQTGSGKTAAFGIPICESVEIEEKAPQALILTPTRELAVQVKENINNIGRFKRIRCEAVYGKQPMNIQIRELKQRVHVVVGTPGRVLDHIKRGTIELQRIKYLVIDEADKMLNMGFIEEVGAIIAAVPQSRTTMLFSATVPEEIEDLCSKYMKAPIRIEITPEELVSNKVTQELYEVERDEKFDLLKDILYLEKPESCIIFCATKDNVDDLNERLKSEDIYCHALHGGMEQADRLRMMKDFKLGKFKILVATDVAARGIDVEDLDLIINYDVPVENESYVHRIGRTARAGKSGKAVTFCSNREKRYLEGIQDYIGYTIPRVPVPPKDETEKEKEEFFRRLKSVSELKSDKSEVLSKDVMKIYINAGKKKKMRPGDIVGAITAIEGVSGEDIGIIDILDYVSYVEVLNGKGKKVLQTLQKTKIKGKEVKVERAANRKE